MILDTNAEQDEMTCCVQESQLWQDGVRGGGGVVGVTFFFLKNTFLVLPYNEDYLIEMSYLGYKFHVIG